MFCVFWTDGRTIPIQALHRSCHIRIQPHAVNICGRNSSLFPLTHPYLSQTKTQKCSTGFMKNFKTFAMLFSSLGTINNHSIAYMLMPSGLYHCFSHHTMCLNHEHSLTSYSISVSNYIMAFINNRGIVYVLCIKLNSS